MSICRYRYDTLQVYKHTYICGSPEYHHGPSVCPVPLPGSQTPLPALRVSCSQGSAVWCLLTNTDTFALTHRHPTLSQPLLPALYPYLHLGPTSCHLVQLENCGWMTPPTYHVWEWYRHSFPSAASTRYMGCTTGTEPFSCLMPVPPSSWLFGHCSTPVAGTEPPVCWKHRPGAPTPPVWVQ